MRSAALDYFFPFTYELEGRVFHMYIDTLGYVTTGVGNLIDSPAAALALPWKRADGSLASADEVTAAWYAVDGARTQPKGIRQDGSIAMQGGNSGAMKSLTSLRLAAEDVDALVLRTLHNFEDTLRRSFPSYDAWPADAQLGLMSMAWGLGANFAHGWPHFTAAANRGDFRTAAEEGQVGNFAPKRNAANKALFLNAADVLETGADADRLYYPGTVSGGGSSGGSSGNGGGILGRVGVVGGVLGVLIGASVAVWAVSRVK